MSNLTSYQLAALDTKSHISLTANAGSGKTLVLSKRFIEIILNEEIDINKIVAITFTERAAGELQRKIAIEAEERFNSEKDQKIKNKLYFLRQNLVSSNISTIHSFCVSILKEYATECGLDVGFIPVDEKIANDLIHLSIEEVLNESNSDEGLNTSIRYLLRLFGSKNQLILSLIKAIEKRKQIEQFTFELYQKTDAEVIEYYKILFEEKCGKYFNNTLSEFIQVVSEINSFVLIDNPTSEYAIEINHLLSNYEKVTLFLQRIKIALSIYSKIFTTTNKLREKQYLKKNIEKYEHHTTLLGKVLNELKYFSEIGEFNDPQEYELIAFGKHFDKVFRRATKKYQDKKTSKRYIDYDDILIYALTVLENDYVKKELQKKYQYFMIDEYQDTDETQYNIFMPIVEYLKSGNLFIVGDEKQSIYRFRNAEIEIFSRTKLDIAAYSGAGKSLNLPHSFRMYPNIVLFVNYLFSRMLTEYNPELGELEYSELICASNSQTLGSVEILLGGEQLEEAELIARKIKQLTAKREIDDYSEVGILCRKRKMFAALDARLAAHGIPYSIIGGKGFYQQQVIYDIYNYLSVLLNNDDDAAMVGVLRSPFFNLSDSQLLKLNQFNGNSIFEKLKLAAVQNSDYEYAYKIISANIQLTKSVDIPQLIRKILNETNYWAIIASRKNNEQDIANLNKIIRIARNYSDKLFSHLFDFTQELKKEILTNEDEGHAQLSEGNNKVRIMTIHQAKGLEFKVVFVVGIDVESRSDSLKSKSISLDKKYGFLTKVPAENNYYKNYSTPIIGALYNYIDHKKNMAEIKRLFYVAATRAIKHLYLTASSPKGDSTSFIELLKSAIASDLDVNSISLEANVKKLDYSSPNNESISQMCMEIPIVKNIDDQESINIEVGVIEQKKFILSRIDDKSKREIISATKINMFEQCPLKYQLTYELGFKPLMTLYEKYDEVNEDDIEDKERVTIPQLKGAIIHKILSENVMEGSVEQSVNYQLLQHKAIIPEDMFEQYKNEICRSVLRWMQSDSYFEINGFQNYYNEYEAYCFKYGHYLFGIIDKLIIESNQVIIIDYKTDKITENQVLERAKNYLTQLKYYSFIISQLYPHISTFILMLIFLEYPDKKISWEISREEVLGYDSHFDKIIKSIESGPYPQNLSHCTKCMYAVKGELCIKNI
jgi:ATP-dependent helicase/nuclease subunit A